MSKTQHALENLHEHNSQGCGHDHHHEDESGHNDNSACGCGHEHYHKGERAMTMMQPVAVGMIIMCPGMQMTVNVSSAIHMRNIAMFVVKAWKIVSAECLMLIV